MNITLKPIATITRSDTDIALDFTRAIPSGRWTNYGEIAECVMAVTPGRTRTISGYSIALKLMHTGLAPWHGLRNTDGLFNVAHIEKRDHAAVQEECDQMLRDEGCSVSGHHANPANHVTANQLLALSGERPKYVPNMLSTEAQRQVAERVAERIARLNYP